LDTYDIGNNPLYCVGDFGDWRVCVDSALLSTQTNLAAQIASHAFVLRVVTCFTGIAVIAVHNATGVQRRKTMDRRSRRIPTWLTVDLTIMAASIIAIAAAM